MPRLNYGTGARRDMVGIFNYVTRESGSIAVARNFMYRIRLKCERLCDLPGQHGTARPDLGDGLRSTPCQGYVIFFRYEPDTLEIVSVLHSSRDAVSYFSEG